ncbi:MULTISPECIES: Maff2 family mobile element protein [unclassified Ruminococcus]|uniref:Maff2 family mobile element protein n=1 Tax=unclassified Ruminococcus TaxID=2608920 RepID=UPI00210E4901|nr:MULTISPECIES: Maff2 family protein [unclassified Ruminococcus]MCQ4021749.1 conjugative transfer protein [Ruminococcus sp. zg-924]MCQ4114193.1 conjugative transfer protein [Ruminococcus sp. zg-921]
MGITSVFAADIDPSGFIKTSMTVLKAVICLIGAGLGVWGVVNLIEGYGSDNAGAKSQGMKQACAGIGLIVLAFLIIPVLEGMFTQAIA